MQAELLKRPVFTTQESNDVTALIDLARDQHLNDDEIFACGNTHHKQYVCVHRHEFSSNRIVLHLAIQSSRYTNERKEAEQKMHSMVNATVQHEFNTTKHSLRCQSDVLKKVKGIVERATEYVSDLTLQPDQSTHLQSKLDLISNIVTAAININVFSEKLSTLLTADFRDLAALHIGKF